jgi:hypothetical protein
MITYRWIISKLRAAPSLQGQTNVVVSVDWILYGTDGTHDASRQGAVDVPYSPDEGFTPYDQLTEAMIIPWVQEAITEPVIASYKKAIELAISQKASPPLITPDLPWATQ